MRGGQMGHERVIRTVERPLVRHIVHEEDAHRSAVVRRRDGPEPLLACSIPLSRAGTALKISKTPRRPFGLEKHTIWSLIRFPSSSIVRILKSMPMVVMKEGVQASSQNRRSRQDFPTPRVRQHREHPLDVL